MLYRFLFTTDPFNETGGINTFWQQPYHRQLYLVLRNMGMWTLVLGLYAGVTFFNLWVIAPFAIIVT